MNIIPEEEKSKPCTRNKRKPIRCCKQLKEGKEKYETKVMKKIKQREYKRDRRENWKRKSKVANLLKEGSERTKDKKIMKDGIPYVEKKNE